MVTSCTPPTRGNGAALQQEGSGSDTQKDFPRIQLTSWHCQRVVEFPLFMRYALGEPPVSEALLRMGDSCIRLAGFG